VITPPAATTFCAPPHAGACPSFGGHPETGLWSGDQPQNRLGTVTHQLRPLRHSSSGTRQSRARHREPDTDDPDILRDISDLRDSRVVGLVMWAAVLLDRDERRVWGLRRQHGARRQRRRFKYPDLLAVDQSACVKLRRSRALIGFLPYTGQAGFRAAYLAGLCDERVELGGC
jgi:hypothetical protein